MTPQYALPAEVEWSFYGTPRFKRHKVLLVGIDGTPGDLLRSQLYEAGFRVISAETGTLALARAAAVMPSLIVLETNLLPNSGFEVCRQLKNHPSTSHIPIIMQKREPTEKQRILGFELGADDFVAKPCGAYEMVLRIKNSIRRAEHDLPAEIKMELGDLVLDPVRHELTIQNKPVDLTSTEFRLLLVFMEHCGRMLDRKTLLNEVWCQPGTALTRTVDTHVRRLRSKLGSWAGHLESVHGIGYRLNETLPSFVKAENEPFEREKPSYLRRLKKVRSAFAVTKRGRVRSTAHRSTMLIGAGKH